MFYPVRRLLPADGDAPIPSEASRTSSGSHVFVGDAITMTRLVLPRRPASKKHRLQRCASASHAHLHPLAMPFVHMEHHSDRHEELLSVEGQSAALAAQWAAIVTPSPSLTNDAVRVRNCGRPLQRRPYACDGGEVSSCLSVTSVARPRTGARARSAPATRVPCSSVASISVVSLPYPNVDPLHRPKQQLAGDVLQQGAPCRALPHRRGSRPASSGYFRRANLVNVRTSRPKSAA